MSRGWRDISVPIHERMVHWPGDPETRIERISDLERGHTCTVSSLSMGSHIGTHIDAPLHFLRTGLAIDKMPFEAMIGVARVIEIQDPGSIKPEELFPHALQQGERILFKTENSTRCWSAESFVADYVYLTAEAARFLAERAIRTVGVDYLSVGGYERNGAEVHRTLLKAGIWIIEGLDLSAVNPGTYELVCLPLRIIDGDGAPARAILGPIDATQK